jgi:hypothetical protein
MAVARIVEEDQRLGGAVRILGMEEIELPSEVRPRYGAG